MFPKTSRKLHDHQGVESCGHQHSDLWRGIATDLQGSLQVIEKRSDFFFS